MTNNNISRRAFLGTAVASTVTTGTAAPHSGGLPT
jgi:hypothetical protein